MPEQKTYLTINDPSQVGPLLQRIDPNLNLDPREVRIVRDIILRFTAVSDEVREILGDLLNHSLNVQTENGDVDIWVTADTMTQVQGFRNTLHKALLKVLRHGAASFRASAVTPGTFPRVFEESTIVDYSCGPTRQVGGAQVWDECWTARPPKTNADGSAEFA